MEIKECLKSLNSFLDQYIIPTQLDENRIKDMKSIVVVRSASIDMFDTFVQKVRDINSNLFINIVTNSNWAKEVGDICKINYTVYEYRYDGPYQLSKMPEIIHKVSKLEVDAYFMLFNNRYGEGYDNVEEILSYLNHEPKELCAFNNLNEFLIIEQFEIRRASKILYQSLINWYWEYQKIK